MRRLWMPALCSLVVLGLLIFLGAWQLQRGTWKRAVLADIAAAETLPAIPMPDTPALFTKVRVEGTLRFDRAALYGAEGRDIANRPVMGAQLVVPLDRPGHPPLLVLLGWVANLPPQNTPTPATIEGYIRAPETPGPFAATDDSAQRRFYTLAPAAIAAALGIAPPSPMILVALGPPTPPPAPDPAHTLPRPTNNHLSYALTWFGLAVGLVGVFAAYARKVLRT
jgi:surfeit locus 1 family protein